MNAGLCAGLTWNGVCAKRAQCSRLGRWWLQNGVEFNRCSSDGQFRHFLALPIAQAPPAVPQQGDLFA